MGTVILHVDMDAYFAQIEQVKNPALRGKPIIVGGDAGHRGVVASCSYEARKYGIHSAMSSAQARILCPNAIFVGGNLTNYVYYSARILGILHSYSPLVEPTSIDEAYIDVTDSVHLYGNPGDLARRIKRSIMQELGLTCSIGISENKLLAKTASDFNKPDGLSTLWRRELKDKFYPLPVGKLRGVGPKTEAILKGWGIDTIGQLAAFPEGKLKARFGIFGSHLKRISNGICEEKVVPQNDLECEQTMSHEHTLYQDTSDLDFLRTLLITLAEKVFLRMREAERVARTVRLRLRYADFTTISREITPPELITDTNSIFRYTAGLIPCEVVRKKKVRLIGVGVKNLIPAGELIQLGLITDESRLRRERCADVMKDIRDKFGRYSILRAASLPFRGEH